MTTARPAQNRPVRQLLAQATRPISDQVAWDRLLQRVNPLWSTAQIRARVVKRTEENTDTFSLWLQTNRHWPGHQAGQHLLLGVEIDGTLHRRAFSLSNRANQTGPDRRLLRVTIQRQPGSGVTAWLHRNAQPGQVFSLGPPAGSFTLPEPTPRRLLMIAGGSGITPLMAILQQLAGEQFNGDAVLLQLCRNADQRLFDRELEQLARQLPGLSILVHDSATGGRLAVERIADLVPDLAQRHALLCGPPGLNADVCALWDELGLADQLQLERFGAPRPTAATGDRRQVIALNSEQSFTQSPAISLLEGAEAAGLSPAYGCRVGLCRSCLCQKRSGTTRNLLTGIRSSQPDEWIQLCVSVAESDLELAL
jgi:stearoyl-CoA 9-desaturase NADPH oxidoreductase